MKDIFASRLLTGLEQLDIPLSPEAVDRLHRYFLELKKWSAKINLIAKSMSDEQLIDNHFLDSLTLLPLLAGDEVHLLDVGSGAGFPGLVLQAARPEIMATLVEPRLKRVSFLKQMARVLVLDRLKVMASRIEDEVQLPSGAGYSHITSRAVTDLGTFLAMVSRFAAPGVQVICMKGPRWQDELAQGQRVIEELGYRLEQKFTRTLPFSRASRALLVFSRSAA